MTAVYLQIFPNSSTNPATGPSPFTLNEAAAANAFSCGRSASRSVP